MNEYEKQIRKYYLDVISEASKLASLGQLNNNGELYLRSNKQLREKIDKLIKELYNNVYASTVASATSGWERANEEMNDAANALFGKSIEQLPKEYITKYFSTNAGARLAFITRKVNDLRLSDRVWRNTQQFRSELELALEYGIGKGRSSQEIARDIKSYLNNPDKLFRRVRDLNGELRLSKNAKSYKPSRGVYRSSYKNALRVARNETNFAYEASQKLKREQQDFIVGIEIKVSKNHNPADDKNGISCQSLQGKYPKTFDFTNKWHVNCKCISYSINKTKEEVFADIERIGNGKNPSTESINKVDALPDNYKNWVKENSKLWENWKNKPNFLKN